VSVFVHIIVGKFDLVEADGLFHPVRSGSRGVGVDIVPAWDWRVSFTGHCPSGAETSWLADFLKLLHR